MIRIEVLQDGATFLFATRDGGTQVIRAPVEVTNDYDVVGARKARTWFREFCLKRSMIPAFV